MVTEEVDLPGVYPALWSCILLDDYEPVSYAFTLYVKQLACKQS